MIRSMTGFGEAERPVEGGRLRVEIRTVNHRFLNTSIRTPSGFDRVENEVQEWLRPFVARGHANVTVAFDRDETVRVDEMPVVDHERARHYVRLLRELRDAHGLGGEVELASVIRFGDVLRTPETKARGPLVATDDLRAVVESAAEALVRMREAEGARLEVDLRARLEGMTEQLDRVAERAPERLVSERDRLRQQIAELTANEEVDEDRLAREVAYLAEKWDINEEIVRYRAHIEAFREALAHGNEPVGKRLSFLVQEMHREANTIGSKANDPVISHASVALKEEIERAREQVENVE